MKRLVVWALLALSLSANVAVAAVAVLHRRSTPADEPRIFSQIPLDADQRSRIAELRARLMTGRDEHFQRLSQLRKQLGTAIMQQPENRPAVDRALQEIAAVQADYQRAVVAHVLAVRDVLRPDQRPGFEKMLVERIGAGVAWSGEQPTPVQCNDCPAGAPTR